MHREIEETERFQILLSGSLFLFGKLFNCVQTYVLFLSIKFPEQKIFDSDLDPDPGRDHSKTFSVKRLNLSFDIDEKYVERDKLVQ